MPLLVARLKNARVVVVTISLLNRSLLAQRFNKKEQASGYRDASFKISDAYRDGREYVQGVDTALWKLGFVEFDSESDVHVGRGRFNPDVQWNQNPDNLTAQLAFNPENELHQMLVSQAGEFANPMIEIETAADSRNPSANYMNLRIVEVAQSMQMAA